LVEYGATVGTWSMTTETCIYCGATFDPSKGAGDHIIPAAFGEFDGDVHFRRICPACNNKIGRCEEELVRCGPAAVLREVVDPAVPRGRRRGRGRVGTRGSRPPRWEADLGSHSEVVDPDRSRPGCVRVVDQIVLQCRDGTCRSVPLYPRMTADVLRKRIAAGGITTVATVWLRCDDEALWDQYSNLLRTVWPESPLKRLESVPADMHSVLTKVALRVSSAYFRAIAKIALHYYLVNNIRCIRGDEPEFEAIRHFIIGGGDPDPFFPREGPQFKLPMGTKVDTGTIVSKRWCHILAADETDTVVTAYVQLFTGPSYVGHGYHVRLALLNSRIYPAARRRGHIYEYYEKQASLGKAGRVRPVSFGCVG
jgi:rubredoxin